MCCLMTQVSSTNICRKTFTKSTIKHSMTDQASLVIHKQQCLSNAHMYDAVHLPTLAKQQRLSETNNARELT